VAAKPLPKATAETIKALPGDQGPPAKVAIILE
jgi:hypothetical protein